MRSHRCWALALVFCLIQGCSGSDGEKVDTGVVAPEDTGAASDTSTILPDTAVTEPPNETDSDGDGLTDAEEIELGTNPEVSDTDGDGYLDGDEVFEGKDPKDPESRIYIGNWPYNRDKDNFVEGDWDAPPGEGVKLPRWKAIDQHGEMVDIYDFIGHGKKVVLDVGTKFCKPCKGLAAWFSTGDIDATTDHCEEPLSSFLWFKKPDYEAVYDMVQNGEIYWITVLWSSCSENGAWATPEDAVFWDEEWPNENIPVLVDVDCQMKFYLDIGAMPHIDVLDEDLNFIVYEKGGPTSGFKHLIGQ
jgi:thiol-disulfide isomerase/thioredoxin